MLVQLPSHINHRLTESDVEPHFCLGSAGCSCQQTFSYDLITIMFVISATVFIFVRKLLHIVVKHLHGIELKKPCAS